MSRAPVSQHSASGAGANLAALVDVADLRVRLERILAGFLAGQRTRLLAVDADLAPVAETLRALILGGGKRLRPAFGYWAYRGAGGVDREDVVSGLASLELLHACALIHDDVMDSSDTRRGAPTA